LRITGATRLIHLPEAAVRGSTGRESILVAVHNQIALDVGIIVGIHDADSRGRTSCPSEAVPGPELHRAIARWRRSGVGIAVLVRGHMGMAAGGARRSRSGTNGPRVRSHSGGR